MANAEGITPSRHEVERQLERMLADPLFLARPRQAEFFEHLVKCALDGEKVSEQTLSDRFLTDKRYAQDTSNVRTTVSHIRTQLLKEYYAGEGKYDPVVISLPAPERSNKQKKNYRLIRLPDGKSYKPSFSYNPAAWTAKELAVADHLLHGSPTQIRQAMEHLNNVARAEPAHPEAMLGTIEGLASMLMLGLLGEPHETLVSGPLSWLDRIEKETRPSWRTRVLRALLRYLVGDRKGAQKEFDKALELDRQATIGRGWYLHFLFETGREEQALRVLALAAEERADHAPMHALYGIYLARAHRHEEAERAFSRSLMLDRNCWLAHHGLAHMHSALGNGAKVQEHLKRLEALVEPAEFEFMRGSLSATPGPS